MKRINRVRVMYQEQLYFSLQAVLTKTLLFAGDRNLFLSLGGRRDIIGMYWGILCDTERAKQATSGRTGVQTRVGDSLNQGFQHKQQLAPSLSSLHLFVVPAQGEEYGY